jgi:hypothetical protein
MLPDQLSSSLFLHQLCPPQQPPQQPPAAAAEGQIPAAGQEPALCAGTAGAKRETCFTSLSEPHLLQTGLSALERTNVSKRLLQSSQTKLKTGMGNPPVSDAHTS